MYLKISGAGLVALVFALVISPVVSIPIPLSSQSSQSGVSSSFSSRNELGRGSADSLRIQNIRRRTTLNDQISTASTQDTTAIAPIASGDVSYCLSNYLLSTSLPSYRSTGFCHSNARFSVIIDELLCNIYCDYQHMYYSSIG